MTTQAPPPPQRESMDIDPYEKNWMRLTIVILVLFIAAITVAGFALGFQLPGVEARVDPRTVATDDPRFSNPGVREIVPGEEYEVYMVAQTFSFVPAEIELPVGARVTFFITARDVQHGFKLQDTNVNMMVLPGQVSRLSTTFERVGVYPYICNEYCGIGHAAMFGTLRVVNPGQTGGDQ
jgi:cytochrome c oxidase subunit II